MCQALTKPGQIELSLRKSLNERLRRKMMSGQGLLKGVFTSHMCSQGSVLLGLKPGLIQQWQSTSDPIQKCLACMGVISYFVLGPSILGIACLLRFQYLKAFLLDRNLSSIQVTSYFEEFLELDFVRASARERERERERVSGLVMLVLSAAS